MLYANNCGYINIPERLYIRGAYVSPQVFKSSGLTVNSETNKVSYSKVSCVVGAKTTTDAKKCSCCKDMEFWAEACGSECYDITWQSQYAHILPDASLVVGHIVEQGDQVGTILANHLHFQLTTPCGYYRIPLSCPFEVVDISCALGWGDECDSWWANEEICSRCDAFITRSLSPPVNIEKPSSFYGIIEHDWIAYTGHSGNYNAIDFLCRHPSDNGPDGRIQKTLQTHELYAGEWAKGGFPAIVRTSKYQPVLVACGGENIISWVSEISYATEEDNAGTPDFPGYYNNVSVRHASTCDLVGGNICVDYPSANLFIRNEYFRDANLRFDVYRDNIKIGEMDSLFYEDKTVDNPKTYKYFVKFVNLDGGAVVGISNEIELTVDCPDLVVVRDCGCCEEDTTPAEVEIQVSGTTSWDGNWTLDTALGDDCVLVSSTNTYPNDGWMELHFDCGDEDPGGSGFGSSNIYLFVYENGDADTGTHVATYSWGFTYEIDVEPSIYDCSVERTLTKFFALPAGGWESASVQLVPG